MLEVGWGEVFVHIEVFCLKGFLLLMLDRKSGECLDAKKMFIFNMNNIDNVLTHYCSCIVTFYANDT